MSLWRLWAGELNIRELYISMLYKSCSEVLYIAMVASSGV